MTIGIYTKRIDHFTETLAYFISFNEQFKVLVIIDITTNIQSDPYCCRCLERLKRIKAIEIVPLNSLPRRLDRLYIYISYTHFLWNSNLNNWVSKAKKIGCLRLSHYKGNRKMVVKEMIYSFPYYMFASSMVFQDAQHIKHPYFFIKNKYFYTPSVHPRFLINKELREKLFAPVKRPDTPRTFKLAFIGNRTPPERTAVLRQIKEKLSTMRNIMLTNTFPSVNDNSDKLNVLWIEYGLETITKGLSPLIYAEVLGEIDFSICPLGWGGNWTHRVVESLVNGAIPILEDEKRYNIGLRDMGNCIVVKGGNWAKAIDKAACLDFEEIHRMYSNIVKLRDKYLLPEVAASRLRKAMLLE